MSRRKWSGRGFVSEPGGWRGHAAGEGTDLRTARAQRAPRHRPASPPEAPSAAGWLWPWGRPFPPVFLGRGKGSRVFRRSACAEVTSGHPRMSAAAVWTWLPGLGGRLLPARLSTACAQGTPHRPWALRRGTASLPPPATDQAGGQPPMGGPGELARPAGRHQRLASPGPRTSTRSGQSSGQSGGSRPPSPRSTEPLTPSAH